MGEIDGRDEFEERLVFVGTGGAEAGTDLIESGVGITGMADEFPDGAGVRRRRGEEGEKSGADGVGASGSGSEDADGAGGGHEAGCADEALEGSVLEVEGGDGEAAEAAGVGGGAEGPGGLEGVANGGDGAGLGGVEERAEDAGEQVGVLVSVDVGDAEASVLKTANLGGGFGSDLFRADAKGEEIADEAGERWPEGLPIGAEGGDL